MKRNEILHRAMNAVWVRGRSYGSPAENFERIAIMWSAILQQNITVKDVGCMMIALKMARLQETPDHEDSWIDIAGYAAVTAEAISDISGNPHPHEDQQNTDSTTQPMDLSDQ